MQWLHSIYAINVDNDNDDDDNNNSNDNNEDNNKMMCNLIASKKRIDTLRSLLEWVFCVCVCDRDDANIYKWFAVGGRVKFSIKCILLRQFIVNICVLAMLLLLLWLLWLLWLLFLFVLYDFDLR